MPYDSKIRDILVKLDLGDSPSSRDVSGALFSYLFRVLEKCERKVRARSTAQDEKLKWSRVGASHSDLIIKMFKIMELEELKAKFEMLKVMVAGKN